MKSLITLVTLMGLMALLPDARAQATSGGLHNIFHLDDPRDPDIAFNGVGYLAVWRDSIEPSGANDYLYGQHLLLDGTPLTNPFIIKDEAVNDPSVAYFQSSNEGLLYVVAYEWGGRIYARTVAPASTVPGDEIQIAGNPSSSQVKPDVGFGLGICRIVWEITGTGIYGANIWVDSFGNFEVLGSFVVSAHSADRDPAIVQHRGGGPQTMATWSRDVAGSPDEILARSWKGLTPDGSGPVFVVTQTSWNARRPDVSAARPDEYMVTWREQEVGGGSPGNVFARRISYPSGAGSTEDVDNRITIAGINNLDEDHPRIQFTGNAYLVTVLRHDSGAATPYSIQSVAVDALGTGVLGSTVTAGAQVAKGHALAAWGPEPLGFDEAMSFVAKESWLTTQGVENRGGAVNAHAGSGCPDGGETMVSTATANNPAFRIELRGAEPNMPSWLVLAPSAFPVPFGSALLVPDFQTFLLYPMGSTTAEGTLAYELALPWWATGFPIWAQHATESPGPYSLCTFDWFDLSEAVRIDLD